LRPNHLGCALVWACKVVLANLVPQLSKGRETRCGLFDTGFAGTFYR